MTDPNRGQECPPQADPPRAGKPLTQAEVGLLRKANKAYQPFDFAVRIVDDRDHWRALVEKLVDRYEGKVLDKDEMIMLAEARRRLEETK